MDASFAADDAMTVRQSGQNSIEETLGAAHDSVLQAWDGFLKAVQSCDRETLRARFSEFEVLLSRQIKLEEEILFPKLEAEAGKLESDPTVPMRLEHRAVEAALDRLAARIRAEDCAALHEQPAQFSPLLRNHLNREKNVLYPVADLVIPAQGRAEIVSRVHGVEDPGGRGVAS